MSRIVDYEFVDSDSANVLNTLIERYEEITGHIMHSSDPERLFLAWVADVIIRERVNQNYIGNQNLPSRASGKNLDALGEWIFSLPRDPAQAAKCTVTFNISIPQDSAVIIPRGTRITDENQTLVWYTTSDAVIAIGSTSVNVMCQCETAGSVGNGYVRGTINTLIDVNNILYFASCFNVSESDGGSEEEQDESYFERMRTVLDSYSTAGAKGSYEYWAKSVSNEISDVKAIRPKIAKTIVLPVVLSSTQDKKIFIGGDFIDIEALEIRTYDLSKQAVADTDYSISELYEGLYVISIIQSGVLSSESQVNVTMYQEDAGKVYLYALMNDGTIATDTIKNAILSTCSDEYVRPLTDFVSVHDPLTIDYDINIKYYVNSDSAIPLVDIQKNVQDAVDKYIQWQHTKLGRDINPAKLWQLLMQTGIKRAEILSPEFTVLNSGLDGGTPEVAKVDTITITNGGYEDE